MTTPAPAGLTAYDFHEGEVRARPVVSFDGQSYVLEAGELADARNCHISESDAPPPPVREVAALTPLGRLITGNPRERRDGEPGRVLIPGGPSLQPGEHAIESVAPLVGTGGRRKTAGPYGEGHGEYAARVVEAADQHPVTRALGRSARLHHRDEGAPVVIFPK